MCYPVFAYTELDTQINTETHTETCGNISADMTIQDTTWPHKITPVLNYSYTIHQYLKYSMHNESYRMNQALRIIRNTFAHSCVMYHHVHTVITRVPSLDRNAAVVLLAKVILSWTTTAMWTIKLRLVAPTLVRISKFDREKDFSTLLWIHEIQNPSQKWLAKRDRPNGCMGPSRPGWNRWSHKVRMTFQLRRSSLHVSRAVTEICHQRLINVKASIGKVSNAILY